MPLSQHLKWSWLTAQSCVTFHGVAWSLMRPTGWKTGTVSFWKDSRWWTWSVWTSLILESSVFLLLLIYGLIKKVKEKGFFSSKSSSVKKNKRMQMRKYKIPGSIWIPSVLECWYLISFFSLIQQWNYVDSPKTIKKKIFFPFSPFMWLNA